MMRFENFAEQAQTVGSVADLKALLGRTLAAEGYDNHILTSLTPGSVGDVAWFDFPDGYAETYLKERWQEVDPILHRSLRAKEPFFWDVVTDSQTLKRQANHCIKSCAELGVHSGLVIPMFGPHQRCDLISISKRQHVDTDRKRVHVLRAICTQAWWTYLQLNSSSSHSDEGIELTNREREVLLWLKDGKSNDQIAEIMNLTERTVQFHISNSMDKLGAANRISAVVIALQRGVIRL